MYKLSEEENSAFQQAFCARTKTSKQLAQSNRHRLADSRSSAGFRPSTKEMVYRIVGQKGEGSHFYDVDGNKYVDISMGFGVLICGHYPDFVKKAITEQMSQGFQLGPETPLMGEAISLFSELTGMTDRDRVSFYSTGTEAVMMAIRMARGRKKGKIAIFENSYHGHYDDVALANNMFTNDRTMVLEYGADASLEKIKHDASEISAVIVEPAQSGNLDLQPKKFLHELREITRQENIALIFDEILTGFRIKPGGAQSWYEVKADMATYGKIIGGGLPVAAVAGDAYYLDQVDGGSWAFGDASYPKENRVMSVGTFNKGPLAMAVCRAVLRHLKEQGPALQESLNAKAQQFFKDVNLFFANSDCPIKISSFGSQFRFTSKYNIDPFIYRLIHKGVYIWENRNLYFSTAHTNEDYEFVKQCIMDSAEEVYRGPPSKKVINIHGRVEEAL